MNRSFAFLSCFRPGASFTSSRITTTTISAQKGVADITSTCEQKIAAVRCYEAQFTPEAMEQLIFALDLKSHRGIAGQSFLSSEPLKVMHPSAFHRGI